MFMGFLVTGAVLSQYPIGWFSDRFGRRQVIILNCLTGFLILFTLSMLDLHGWALYALIGLVGGFTLPLYSLGAAYTNDYLTPNQMVAASGVMVLSNGTGAAIGAPLTAFYMDIAGPQAFYQVTGVCLGLVGLFAIWRATQRDAIDIEEQGEFVPLAPTPISAALNPELNLDELQAASEASLEEVENSFDELIENLQTEK
jgi:MFS family permease